MSLCPICRRMYCDHTPGERGQTYGEMMREATPEELDEVHAYNESIRRQLVRDGLINAPDITVTLPEGFDPGERTITPQYFGD